MSGCFGWLKRVSVSRLYSRTKLAFSPVGGSVVILIPERQTEGQMKKEKETKWVCVFFPEQCDAMYADNHLIAWVFVNSKLIHHSMDVLAPINNRPSCRTASNLNQLPGMGWPYGTIRSQIELPTWARVLQIKNKLPPSQQHCSRVDPADAPFCCLIQGCITMRVGPDYI